MTRRSFRFLPLLVALSVAPSISLRGAHGAPPPSCPGDLNGDGEVRINELITAVNTSLDGCKAGCGDDIIQSMLGEQCEGTDLDGASCSSLGFASGALDCSELCEFDTRACACASSGGGGLLATGQTLCDQGAGTLGPCPGLPEGQDGTFQAGAPFSYMDNGDGTITDKVTGLMWEKLSDDGGIHDWDNTYLWPEAFVEKIATLNSGSGFAGYTDWRVPNRRELESLIDAGRDSPPVVDPALDTACEPRCTVTTCSCTQSDYYWSSTSSASTPNSAWAVNFNLGDVAAYEKIADIEYPVRAVRGGL